MPPSQRFSRILRVVPFVIALVAFAIYFGQGGFGGGHGKFDRILSVLGFPWIFIPYGRFIFPADFIWLILIPLVFNSLVVTLVLMVFKRINKGSS
jgi:hypothetical protein